MENSYSDLRTRPPTPYLKRANQDSDTELLEVSDQPVSVYGYEMTNEAQMMARGIELVLQLKEVKNSLPSDLQKNLTDYIITKYNDPLGPLEKQIRSASGPNQEALYQIRGVALEQNLLTDKSILKKSTGHKRLEAALRSHLGDQYPAFATQQRKLKAKDMVANIDAAILAQVDPQKFMQGLENGGFGYLVKSHLQHTEPQPPNSSAMDTQGLTKAGSNRISQKEQDNISVKSALPSSRPASCASSPDGSPILDRSVSGRRSLPLMGSQRNNQEHRTKSLNHSSSVRGLATQHRQMPGAIAVLPPHTPSVQKDKSQTHSPVLSQQTGVNKTQLPDKTGTHLEELDNLADHLKVLGQKTITPPNATSAIPAQYERQTPQSDDELPLPPYPKSENDTVPKTTQTIPHAEKNTSTPPLEYRGTSEPFQLEGFATIKRTPLSHISCTYQPPTIHQAESGSMTNSQANNRPHFPTFKGPLQKEPADISSPPGQRSQYFHTVKK